MLRSGWYAMRKEGMPRPWQLGETDNSRQCTAADEAGSSFTFEENGVGRSPKDGQNQKQDEVSFHDRVFAQTDRGCSGEREQMQHSQK